MTFAPGDTLQCIDNTGRERLLQKYQHYEAQPGTTEKWVTIDIEPDWTMELRADRFELVRKAPVKPKPRMVPMPAVDAPLQAA